MAKQNANIQWINWAKFICIILVYLYHSETRSRYFIDGLDKFYKPFFVNLFFILSGYLLYFSQTKKELINLTSKEWFAQSGRKMLSNILYKICIPTILFSAIMYAPKMLIRLKGVSLSNFIEQVVFGHTMWFTWALAVGELLLFLLLFWRRVSLRFVISFGCLCALLALTLSQFFNLPNFPWFYQAGFFSVFYFSIGALYLSLEKKEIKHLWLKEIVYAIGVVLVLLIIFNYGSGHSAINSLPKYDCMGFLLSVVMSLLVVHYCKKFPDIKFVNEIGRNTLGLYLMSGALPELTSLFFHKYFAYNDMLILVIAIVSFGVGLILNTFILKYMPFLYDFRKIKAKAD